MKAVSPAWAGMIPMLMTDEELEASKPRMGGDDPILNGLLNSDGR